MPAEADTPPPAGSESDKIDPHAPTMPGSISPLGRTPPSETSIPAELRPGVKLGRYLLKERIGSGGMGWVYRAFDADLKRDVALKVMRSDLLENETLLRRFHQEAEAAAGLSHPGIVSVHGAGQEGSWQFFTMDLVEGTDLDKWLATGGHARVSFRGFRVHHGFRNSVFGAVGVFRAQLLFGDKELRQLSGEDWLPLRHGRSARDSRDLLDLMDEARLDRFLQYRIFNHQLG